jgi:cell division septum initiation protein DivIVA
MPEDTIGPESFSTRGIPTARRGYDRKVVDALVEEAVAAWRALEERHRELVAEVDRSGGMQFLERDLSAISADVKRILDAATAAADGIRARATEDAARVVAEAEAAVAEIRAAARADAARTQTEADRQAFGLRRDAWDAGMDLLGSVQREVAETLRAAEDEAQVIRADAEKETHRRMAITRREADDIIRNAKFEADRQLNLARELAQEMLDRVQGDKAPVIPTAAERHRRQEIIGELDRLRSERTIEDVTVLPAEPAPEPDDSPEVLFGVLDPQTPSLSDALAAEVGRLRGDEPPAKPPRGRKIGRPQPEQAPEAEAEEPEAGDERAAPPSGDDVRTLFDALRSTAETEAAVVLPGDPMELRDRLALPLHNQGLRDVKRRIVDMQNAALDALGASRAWTPDPEAMTAELATALGPIVQKAATAGATAAGALAGIAAPEPVTSGRPAALIKAMAADLGTAIRSALTGGGGPAESSASVSRVFRAWRGDQAERWVRSVTFAAYHDSLVGGLAAAGVATVAGVGSGRPCPSCVGPAGVEWRPGTPPPDGLLVPPAELDCICTVRPAAN